jgi:hypothetical protein
MPRRTISSRAGEPVRSGCLVSDLGRTRSGKLQSGSAGRDDREQHLIAHLAHIAAQARGNSLPRLAKCSIEDGVGGRKPHSVAQAIAHEVDETLDGGDGVLPSEGLNLV